MLQPVEGQLPTGVPKAEVSIELSLLDSELGIADLWKFGSVPGNTYHPYRNSLRRTKC